MKKKMSMLVQIVVFSTSPIIDLFLPLDLSKMIEGSFLTSGSGSGVFSGKLGGYPKVAISLLILSALALIGIPVQCIANGYRHFFPFKRWYLTANSPLASVKV